MKKKAANHSFFLLEVLIALMLISLCSLPLAQAPMKYFLSELTLLEQIESERIFDLTYCEIQQYLHNNPSQKDLYKNKKLEPKEIFIDGLYKKQIKRQYCLSHKKEKEVGNILYVYLTATITLSTDGWQHPITSEYDLIITHPKQVTNNVTALSLYYKNKHQNLQVKKIV